MTAGEKVLFREKEVQWPRQRGSNGKLKEERFHSTYAESHIVGKRLLSQKKKED